MAKAHILAVHFVGVAGSQAQRRSSGSIAKAQAGLPIRAFCEAAGRS